MSKPIDTRTVLLAPGVAMTLCWIPPGRFRMGSRDGGPSEQPVHEVEITQGFWLGQTPMTQQQCAAFDPEHRNRFHGNPERPAENLTWQQAIDFCNWLKKCLPTPEWADCSVGLPSEAQWEYACRAGTGTDYHTGDGEVALHRAGWFGKNWTEERHTPFHQLDANGFGLYDMHGNVWELCRDAWDEGAYRKRAARAPDPVVSAGAATDTARVVRGGAWASPPGTAVPRSAAGTTLATGPSPWAFAWLCSPVPRAQTRQVPARAASARRDAARGAPERRRMATPRRSMDATPLRVRRGQGGCERSEAMAPGNTHRVILPSTARKTIPPPENKASAADQGVTVTGNQMAISGASA